MTGEEHYTEAERLLGCEGEESVAQVHATLALADFQRRVAETFDHLSYDVHEVASTIMKYGFPVTVNKT